MAKLSAYIRTVVGAFALAFLVVAFAGSVTPASAQAPAGVSEQQLLNQLKPGGAISGRISIPDQKAANLIHPAGRDWRVFQTVWLPWIGGIAIILIIVGCLGFYLWRGAIPIEEGRSGRLVLRFNAVERFTHWLTAASFVVLAITGLNITFGRGLLLPVIGPSAFSTWSEWAKYTHNFVSFAFTLGVLLMFLIWISQNFPTKADIEWLKRGGGMFTKRGGDHPPAWKFNAGQKLLYWAVVVAGLAMIITGYMLMFPFYGGLTIDSMTLANVFHGVVGVLFVAMILAHIYLGTLGMEGAFEAMGSGPVDYNWAKEHHPLWLKEEIERQPQGSGARPAATPAE